MKPITIVYHDNCHDGITAFWCAAQALDNAEGYPASYSQKPDLEKLKDRHLVFVDFCWPPAVMREIARVAASMLVLDHHKSAAEAMFSAENPGGAGFSSAHIFDASGWKAHSWNRHLENVMQDRLENADINGVTIYCLFDMNRSGAGLAWDFFMPNFPRPKLVDYVEDRDLWRFSLPLSKEVHAACGLRPLTYEARNELMRQPIIELAAVGSSVKQYHDRLCKDAAGFALREEIGGYNVPSLSLPLLALGSDVAHILCQGEPFAAYWMDRPDGTRYYGLRSSETGIDVSEIAKQYGGGGHKHAAGFTKKKQ